MKIIFSQNSLLDAKEAKAWYNKQKENLGEKFQSEIKSTVYKISKSHRNYQIRYENIRMANLNVFPFAIHFKVDEKNSTILIISIFHFRKEPNWG
ncbi:hypothetical protein I5M32_03255 [Pedobacter sp. SD-b]|uniref:ParE toxin of type II toxin-antitoxin system, parDE n=1 Tax=Pedobacter segetis TaxID=2793069 RepID=A0ABS1BGP6_9SPHI|nr:hypothetical protein [Pedobacter segetis]MBK0381966.1 hypothetical protein [Pedobacter segetis]